MSFPRKTTDGFACLDRRRSFLTFLSGRQKIKYSMWFKSSATMFSVIQWIFFQYRGCRRKFSVIHTVYISK